jgi:hypothetical protein
MIEVLIDTLIPARAQRAFGKMGSDPRAMSTSRPDFSKSALRAVDAD